MKKHLIAWGILSTMFMANTFAQKDIDRPIMGWSSWNTYHVNISEELIKQQADALIKHGPVSYTHLRAHETKATTISI